MRGYSWNIVHWCLKESDHIWIVLFFVLWHWFSVCPRIHNSYQITIIDLSKCASVPDAHFEWLNIVIGQVLYTDNQKKVTTLCFITCAMVSIFKSTPNRQLLSDFHDWALYARVMLRRAFWMVKHGDTTSITMWWYDQYHNVSGSMIKNIAGLGR